MGGAVAPEDFGRTRSRQHQDLERQRVRGGCGREDAQYGGEGENEADGGFPHGDKLAKASLEGQGTIALAGIRRSVPSKRKARLVCPTGPEVAHGIERYRYRT